MNAWKILKLTLLTCLDSGKSPFLETYETLGSGFKYFLLSSLFGEDSHFDEYFSNGLKPPTRTYILCFSTAFVPQNIHPPFFRKRFPTGKLPGKRGIPLCWTLPFRCRVGGVVSRWLLTVIFRWPWMSIGILPWKKKQRKKVIENDGHDDHDVWNLSTWWFQKLFIFTTIWGRFPIWLIFFTWVETTNQIWNLQTDLVDSKIGWPITFHLNAWCWRSAFHIGVAPYQHHTVLRRLL